MAENYLRTFFPESKSLLPLWLAVSLFAFADGVSADTVSAERLEQGRELAMSRKKGNCLACHVINGGELPGNIGPPLVHMKQRFPDLDALRAQIWDATRRNPDTRMPPFGRHEILSEEEIDLIVVYIHSL